MRKYKRLGVRASEVASGVDAASAGGTGNGGFRLGGLPVNAPVQADTDSESDAEDSHAGYETDLDEPEPEEQEPPPKKKKSRVKKILSKTRRGMRTLLNSRAVEGTVDAIDFGGNLASPMPPIGGLFRSKNEPLKAGRLQKTAATVFEWIGGERPNKEQRKVINAGRKDKKRAEKAVNKNRTQAYAKELFQPTPKQSSLPRSLLIATREPSSMSFEKFFAWSSK